MPCFDEIADKQCKILLLGSFPGLASQQKQQYYGHPQNSFWKILSVLLEENLKDAAYEEKKSLLLKHQIALWDVVYTHANEGADSDDNHIIHMVPNDFERFFRSYPNIKAIYFNGSKAYELFRRLKLSAYVPEGVAYEGHKLLSTSPANAQYRFEQKVENWRQILTSLEG